MRPTTLLLLALSACDDGDPREDDTVAKCPAPLSIDVGCGNPAAGRTQAEQDAAQAAAEVMVEIQRRHEDEILDTPGVLFIYIGWDCATDAAAFFVVYDETGPCPEDLPSELEGVPVYLEPGEVPPPPPR